MKYKQRAGAIALGQFGTIFQEIFMQIEKQAGRIQASDLQLSSGGPSGVRTLDLGIKSPLLCQLS
jgi:hypothetical protein